MLEGKPVRYVTDEKYPTQDKYDRLLAYIYVGDKFYNAETVKNGYAFAYTRFPFKYEKNFVKLQKDAKRKGLGLWHGCEVKCKDVCNTNPVNKGGL